MRMPWNFLSGRKSKKTPLKNNVEKPPASSVISLKIRVADGADLPQHSNTMVVAPIVGPLRSELDVAPEIVAAPLQEKETAKAVNNVVVSSEVETEELNGSGTDEVQATDDKVPTLNVASEEPQTEAILMSLGQVQTNEAPRLSDEPVQSILGSPKPVAKPPIIDLQNTRTRSADKEMAELDEEIGELRRVLSSKLSVQNDQLRKLLRRYPE